MPTDAITCEGLVVVEHRAGHFSVDAEVGGKTMRVLARLVYRLTGARHLPPPEAP